MEHIQNEFDGDIQYVCISSPRGLQTSCPTIYIQIILERIINKRSYFMRSIAGLYKFT